MLWLTLADSSAKSDSLPNCRVLADTPYVFSLQLVHERGRPIAMSLPAFDFQLEGSSRGPVVQLIICGGRIQAIDGLVFRRTQITNYQSRHSATENTIDHVPLLGLIPVAHGQAPVVTGNTVVQNAIVTIQAYEDALVFSFDDFKAAFATLVAKDFAMGVSAEGYLGSFIFFGSLAKEILSKAN